jgi:hypothetical protein
MVHLPKVLFYRPWTKMPKLNVIKINDSWYRLTHNQTRWLFAGKSISYFHLPWFPWIEMSVKYFKNLTNPTRLNRKESTAWIWTARIKTPWQFLKQSWLLNRIITTARFGLTVFLAVALLGKNRSKLELQLINSF